MLVCIWNGFSFYIQIKNNNKKKIEHLFLLHNIYKNTYIFRGKVYIGGCKEGMKDPWLCLGENKKKT